MNKEKKEELEYIDGIPAFDVVPIQECFAVTGTRPISTKWTCVNKGDDTDPEIRARWVAREFNNSPSDAFFAGTPPWEIVRLLISLAASQRCTRRRGGGGGGGRKSIKIGVTDISRAYFHAKLSQPTYVDLPPERQKDGYCARLNVALYGTRGAAAAWSDQYSGDLISWDFMRCRSCPCMFRHTSRDILVVVHGDDFIYLASDEDLDWFEVKLSSAYKCKVKGRLGPDRGDIKEMKVLNRVIQWRRDGITLEADQRHAEIIIRELGLERGNSVRTPGENLAVKEGDNEELGVEEARAFRALAARANFLAQDRSDIQYSCKEICRAMARPVRADWYRLKRLGRYLKGKPRVLQWFRWQELPHSLEVIVDSDYAGCKQTRKSTSGGGMKLGLHTLRTWSSTQLTIALSSGEAEYNAIVKGASVGLGMKAMAGELGVNLKLTIKTDLSAAKGITSRRGLGKTRHIAVHLLWVQERLAKGDFALVKIPGKTNPADMLTKFLTGDMLDGFIQKWEQEAHEGRSALTPSLTEMA